MLGTGTLLTAGVQALANVEASKSGTSVANASTKGLLGSIESWGVNALTGGEQLLLGVGITFGEAQFSAVVDGAKAYKGAIAAGSSPTDAWNAAYAAMGKDESVAFSEAQLAIADSIITIFSVLPTI